MSFQPDLEGVKKTLGRFPFPQDVVIEVIANCNLKCVMCPQPNLQRKSGEMSFELFKKIADEIAVEKSPNFRLWLAIMGEPLIMGSRAAKMIKYAAGKGISVHLNTNALLMNEDLARELLDTGLDEIIFSLDAATAGTYSKIRVGGDFNTAVTNIKRMLDMRDSDGSDHPHLVAQFIIMDENRHEVEEFKKFWKGQNIVLKIRPRLGWGTGVEANDLTLPDSERNFPCPWLNRTMSIQWNGTVNQCDADYEGTHSPGDISKQTLKEVWQGELAKRRERHWNNDFTHALCKDCKDWQAGRSLFINPEKAVGK